MTQIIKDKLIVNTTYLTGAFFTQKILAFIYFVIIARLLKVEDVGAYTVALSFTTIFGIFIDFGTGPALTRTLAKNNEMTNEKINSIISLKVLLSVIVYFITISISYILFPASIIKLIMISGMVMVADSFVLTLYSALRGFQILRYESHGVVINQILSMSIGLVGLIFINRVAEFILFGFLIGSLGNGVYALWRLYKHYDYHFSWRFSKSEFFSMFRISTPFALSGIFTRIYSYVDSIILQRFLGNGAVGFYSVAYKIPFALQFIPNAFSASLYPAMSRLHAQNEIGSLSKSWFVATRYLIILSIPMSVGLYLIADTVILQFYGSAYESSIEILRILIVGLFFIFVNFPFGALFASTDRQYINTMLIACTMVINIIFNMILIPRYGGIGASFAFLISHGFLFLTSMYNASRLIKIDFLRFGIVLLKSIIASFFMAGAVWFMEPFSLFGAIIVGGLIYLISSIAIGLFSILEIKEFTMPFSRIYSRFFNGSL